MKSVLVTLAVAASLVLYSCGGGSSSENASNNAPVSNAGSEPAKMDNKEAIDVNAPSKSKGVGKFSDVSVGTSIDAQMADKGKEVFQTKCTVCHQATDQKLIGPGLKGITKIRTPEWIMNMISDPEKMTHSDPVAVALFDEFNHTQMTNQGLTDEETRQVLEFLRQNDAQ